MEISKLIDQYNHHMGAVDQFDQLKSYYDTLRIHDKTWRSLFHFLFDVVLVNSFKLSTFCSGFKAKRSGHRTFLLELVAQLQEASGNKPIRYDSRRQSVNDLQLEAGAIHQQGRLYKDGNSKACVICAARGQRKPLKKADVNATRQVARTVKGCTLCQMPICFEKNGSECWKEHIQAVNARNSTAAI